MLAKHARPIAVEYIGRYEPTLRRIVAGASALYHIEINAFAPSTGSGFEY